MEKRGDAGRRIRGAFAQSAKIPNENLALTVLLRASLYMMSSQLSVARLKWS
jgi:hypothetical protein